VSLRSEARVLDPGSDVRSGQDPAMAQQVRDEFARLRRALSALGDLATPVVTTSAASLTVEDQDGTYLVDATGGNRVVTLPTLNTGSPDSSVEAGRSYWVKKLDATANTVTVTPAAGETIDGAANYVLTAQWKFVQVRAGVSSGTTLAWFIVAAG